MNPNYVKLAVLLAALRDAKARRLDPEEPRHYVHRFCLTMETAFKKSHQYVIALTLRELAREVRSTPSLSELLVKVEREAIDDVVSRAVPLSNTGPTDVSEPTAVETERMLKDGRE